jgi:NAD(P)H-hydrate repair Nnr-like enzyme with NAD(P)H-hydrate epimerase domain
VAQQLDEELMAPDRGGFALEQLMELAGLGCAQAILHLYGPVRMLVCCGT